MWYNDALTQLDYYNVHYYDPLVGIFLSADKVQGNYIRYWTEQLLEEATKAFYWGDRQEGKQVLQHLACMPEESTEMLLESLFEKGDSREMDCKRTH